MAGFGTLIVGGASVLMGAAAAFFAPAAIDYVARLHRTVQIRGRYTRGVKGDFKELLLADFCTNGMVLSRPFAHVLAKLPAFERLTRQAARSLSYRIPTCMSKAIGESLCMASALCALLAYGLSGQLLLGAAGFMFPLFLTHLKAEAWLRARKIQLREQIPDAIRGLGMCFMAGLSLEQAFDQTAQECREPLRCELRKTVDDLRTGSTVSASLAGLDARLAIDEMRFVALALEIQHRTGGSMRKVLDSAADSLLASFDLSRSLEVQTAQARLSARIVSLLPVILVLVLSVAMEGYLASFFASPAGFALFLCAAGMQIAGILFIRKILGIDLE